MVIDMLYKELEPDLQLLPEAFFGDILRDFLIKGKKVVSSHVLVFNQIGSGNN
jgi:hypothetical protein